MIEHTLDEISQYLDEHIFSTHMFLMHTYTWSIHSHMMIAWPLWLPSDNSNCYIGSFYNGWDGISFMSFNLLKEKRWF